MISIFLRDWMGRNMQRSLTSKASYSMDIFVYGCWWRVSEFMSLWKQPEKVTNIAILLLSFFCMLLSNCLMILVVEYKEYIVFDKSISYRYYSITSIGQINRNETKMNRLMPSVYIRIKMRPWASELRQFEVQFLQNMVSNLSKVLWYLHFYLFW